MQLRFSNNQLRPCDENLLNFLLAVKNAWRDGHVETPYYFASQSVRERAFSELLFCKSLDVKTENDGNRLSQPFLSFPAVRECTLLRVFWPPCPLTVAEIVDWLNVVSRSTEPKRFDIHHSDLHDSVENLVQQLKTVSFRHNQGVSSPVWEKGRGVDTGSITYFLAPSLTSKMPLKLLFSGMTHPFLEDVRTKSIVISGLP